MGRELATALKKRAGDDVPTWAYRLGLGAAIFVFGGLSLWWLQDIVGKVNNLGDQVIKIREDQVQTKADTTAIRRDVERVEKKQDQGAEKFDRFERDYRRDQRSIEDKLEKKQDKK